MPQSHTWQPLCVYRCGNRLERVTKAEKSLGVRLAIYIYHTSNSCECNGVNGEPLQLRVFFSLQVAQDSISGTASHTLRLNMH